MIVSDPRVFVADVNRKKFDELFAAEGLARVMSAGAEKESTETTAGSESGIGAGDYAKGSPFGQS
jgi:hypothetical protein